MQKDVEKELLQGNTNGGCHNYKMDSKGDILLETLKA